MPDDLDLDTIEARAEAATPGRWYAESHDSRVFLDEWLVLCDEADEHPVWYHAGDGKVSQTNAEFIAHARTDVPALLAEVWRQTGQLQALDDLIDEAIGLAEKGVDPSGPLWQARAMLRPGSPDVAQSKEAQ